MLVLSVVLARLHPGMFRHARNHGRHNRAMITGPKRAHGARLRQAGAGLLRNSAYGEKDTGVEKAAREIKEQEYMSGGQATNAATGTDEANEAVECTRRVGCGAGWLGWAAGATGERGRQGLRRERGECMDGTIVFQLDSHWEKSTGRQIPSGSREGAKMEKNKRQRARAVWASVPTTAVSVSGRGGRHTPGATSCQSVSVSASASASVTIGRGATEATLR
jgi:hypothetical protein